MYKIYINGTPLFLASTKEFKTIELAGKNHIKTRYYGKRKSLFAYIDLLEKNTTYDGILIYADDVKGLFKEFKSLFKIIKAAGGVVENDKGEILMIYRMKHWDLPKGKIDKGEKKKGAAIREVQEETGLENIELRSTIGKTYHTYRDQKNRRIFKITYWYEMHTTDHELTPQAEEDIEEAIFVDLPTFFKTPRKTYGNILDILRKVDLIE